MSWWADEQVRLHFAGAENTDFLSASDLNTMQIYILALTQARRSFAVWLTLRHGTNPISHRPHRMWTMQDLNVKLRQFDSHHQCRSEELSRLIHLI